MQMTIVLMLLYAGIHAAQDYAQCGGGLTLIGRTCFFVDKKIKKSRAAAEIFCLKKGAHLAHPRTRQENSEIEKYLNTFDSGFWFFTNMFWFGLKRVSSGEFEFTQGKPGYSHWQKGEPSGRGENCCGYVCKDHHCQWNDAMCSQEKMFVCQLRVCPRACLHKSDTNSTPTTTTTTKLPFSDTVSRVTKDETQRFLTPTPPSGYSWSTLTPEAATVITGQQADQTEAEVKVNNRVKVTEVQKQYNVCPRACLHKSDTNSTPTTTTTTKLPFSDTVSRVTKDETQRFLTPTPPSGYSWSTLTPEAATVITGQQAGQTEAEVKVNNRVKVTEVQKQYNGSKSGCGSVFLGLLLVPLLICVMQIL